MTSQGVVKLKLKFITFLSYGSYRIVFNFSWKLIVLFSERKGVELWVEALSILFGHELRHKFHILSSLKMFVM